MLLIGKPFINGPCSMAMLNDQRVKSRNQVDQHKKIWKRKEGQTDTQWQVKDKKAIKKETKTSLKKGKKLWSTKMRPQKKKNTREMPKGKTKCGQKGYDKGATILHPLVDCDVSQLTYLNIMLDANFCSLESHFPKTLLFPILQVNRMVVMLGYVGMYTRS